MDILLVENCVVVQKTTMPIILYRGDFVTEDHPIIWGDFVQGTLNHLYIYGGDFVHTYTCSLLYYLCWSTSNYSCIIGRLFCA